MADSVVTSDSAASSDARPSPPASSDASPGVPEAAATPALRVDFYVLEAVSPNARLRLACKLAEKAYLSDQSALVWHTDEDELRVFDDLLWTFMDGSFVPHDVLLPGDSTPSAPVLLSVGRPPAARVDVIINLAPLLPSCLGQTHRVAEIIDGDEARRRAGRTRFKAYRELGAQPSSHNIRGD